MYRTVYDLAPNELNELKTALFYDPETIDILPNYIAFPEQIPDDIIFHHYDGLTFTNDDFFSNIHLPF